MSDSILLARLAVLEQDREKVLGRLEQVAGWLEQADRELRDHDITKAQMRLDEGRRLLNITRRDSEALA